MATTNPQITPVVLDDKEKYSRQNLPTLFKLLDQFIIDHAAMLATACTSLIAAYHRNWRYDNQHLPLADRAPVLESFDFTLTLDQGKAAFYGNPYLLRLSLTQKPGISFVVYAINDWASYSHCCGIGAINGFSSGRAGGASFAYPRGVYDFMRLCFTYNRGRIPVDYRGSARRFIMHLVSGHDEVFPNTEKYLKALKKDPSVFYNPEWHEAINQHCEVESYHHFKNENSGNIITTVIFNMTK
jgi:hypothetical protein